MSLPLGLAGLSSVNMPSNGSQADCADELSLIQKKIFFQMKIG